MKSSAASRFWQCYGSLPEQVRRQAREAYELFSHDPHYPSLRFKRVHPTQPIFSVRIGLGFRAVGIVEGDEITWFWIGSHAESDALLKRLRNA